MLTTTSEHALRALTYLARLPEGSSILGRELAKEASIPANYLSKILWTLGNAGIIDATRGSGGGYRLRRGPGAARLFSRRWEGLRLRESLHRTRSMARRPHRISGLPAHQDGSGYFEIG